MPLRRLTFALATLAMLQGQPTFRSGAELIRLDVSVVDRDGRPMRGLDREDFIVRIDGKLRPVSFVRFYGPDDEPPIRGTVEGTPSFASNSSGAQGRVVVLVADLESMEPGYERALLDGAGALVDTLAARDSVGLLPIPGKGIDLTRDHARVREALTHLHGLPNDVLQHEHVIGVREAEAIVAGNAHALREVSDRECIPTDSKCPREIATREAPQLLREVDRRIQNVVHTLSDLTERLRAIDVPRTIVLISAGLPFRPSLAPLFRELGQHAAETGVRTFVLQVEQPEMDATRGGRARISSLPKGDLADGLSTIAGVTGGTFRAGVGRATGVLERVRAELVHSYQLGVQSVPGDADGKSHSIEVQVRRPAAEVHAKRELVVSHARERPRSAVDVLNLPPGAADVPMTASAFSTLGDKAPDLKVVLLVETFGGSPPASFALRLTNVADERAVFQTSDVLAAHGSGGRALLATQIPPGQYWLRAAVLDAETRAGSVEMPLSVGLHQVGALQCSDLLVGTGDDRFAPATHVRSGEPVIAFLELYAASASFSDVTVDFEARATRSGEVVARTAASLMWGIDDNRRVADGRLTVPATAPGTYVISAVVKQKGRELGTVQRTLVTQ